MLLSLLCACTVRLKHYKLPSPANSNNRLHLLLFLRHFTECPHCNVFLRLLHIPVKNCPRCCYDASYYATVHTQGSIRMTVLMGTEHMGFFSEKRTQCAVDSHIHAVASNLCLSRSTCRTEVANSLLRFLFYIMSGPAACERVCVREGGSASSHVCVCSYNPLCVYQIVMLD